jgi:hypothetical protein
MTDERPVLTEYSPLRSALKGLGAAGQATVALVLTVAGALYADPEFAEHVRELLVGHPRALMVVGALIVVGRGLANYRKQHR